MAILDNFYFKDNQDRGLQSMLILLGVNIFNAMEEDSK